MIESPSQYISYDPTVSGDITITPTAVKGKRLIIHNTGTANNVIFNDGTSNVFTLGPGFWKEVSCDLNGDWQYPMAYENWEPNNVPTYIDNLIWNGMKKLNSTFYCLDYKLQTLFGNQTPWSFSFIWAYFSPELNTALLLGSFYNSTTAPYTLNQDKVYQKVDMSSYYTEQWSFWGPTWDAVNSQWIDIGKAYVGGTTWTDSIFKSTDGHTWTRADAPWHSTLGFLDVIGVTSVEIKIGKNGLLYFFFVDSSWNTYYCYSADGTSWTWDQIGLSESIGSTPVSKTWEYSPELDLYVICFSGTSTIPLFYCSTLTGTFLEGIYQAAPGDGANKTASEIKWVGDKFICNVVESPNSETLQAIYGYSSDGVNWYYYNIANVSNSYPLKYTFDFNPYLKIIVGVVKGSQLSLLPSGYLKIVLELDLSKIYFTDLRELNSVNVVYKITFIPEWMKFMMVASTTSGTAPSGIYFTA